MEQRVGKRWYREVSRTAEPYQYEAGDGPIYCIENTRLRMECGRRCDRIPGPSNL